MAARIINVSFDSSYPLQETSIRLLQETTGLYFIHVQSMTIPYPFQPSRLLYIGMSASRQSSIASRLRGHLSGTSGNTAIANYATSHIVEFTSLRASFLSELDSNPIEALESIFIEDFSRIHGSRPICNNQSGVTLENKTAINPRFNIDWAAFR